MKIGMIFPGYGSQFVGMAKDVYDESRAMQEYFDQASLCVDINFIKLCFASSDAELSRMQQAYSALFVTSSSLYATLVQEGIEPDIVAGYNVGQYAAMHAAKGLSFADGLYVLKKLTFFAQEHLDKHAFATARVKGPSTDELSMLLKQTVQDRIVISAYEMPNQHLITGSEDDVHEWIRQCKEMPGIKEITEIPATFGLHTAAMQPVTDVFKIYLEKVDFKDTAIPVVSQVTGTLTQEGARLKDDAMQHLTQPIQWFSCLKELHICDIILSVGPGTMLVETAKQLYPNKVILPVTSAADIAEVKKIIEEKKAIQVESELSEIEHKQIG